MHIEADRTMGERIRALRRERSLSLMDIAQRTGYSVGYLSQIERGLSSPSLRTMVALGEAFGIGLSGLFSRGASASEGDSDGVVVRASERGRMDLWRTGIDKAILTPHDEAFGLDLYLMKIAPGGFSDEDFFAHSGEEAGVVIEGTMELNVAGSSWMLQTGDSFRFASNRPHRYRNPSSTLPTQVLWATHTPMDPAKGTRMPRKPVPLRQNPDGTFSGGPAEVDPGALSDE
ncbi:transcriptional regulator (plasmid) [Neorhizobium sp. NCHU2750]|nr:transcriptional regulator [Neorhizobium sp. NCHU2750]